jgi:hypothetical protein
MKKVTLLSFLLFILNVLIAGNISFSKDNTITKNTDNNQVKLGENLVSGHTVSFTIYDGAMVLADAWVTFNDESIQTDSTGIAVFTQVPEGSLPFLVNLPGYMDSTDEVDISGDQSIDVYMNKFHSLKFTITDGTNPLPGAIVAISGDTATADIHGIAMFGIKYPGNSSYSFTVSALGFADSTGYADVGTSDLTVDPIILKKAYDVIFTVTDSLHNPIEGAVVTINDEEIATDSDGHALFSKKINGIYSYEIILSGYANKNANIEVNSSNVSDTVILPSGLDLLLTIINGPSGSSPLEGDTLVINGITKISDENGLVRYGLHPGSYPFLVHKTGFTDTSLSVQIVDQNLDLTVYLTPSYSVAFNVSDVMTYIPIEAATVTFNGIKKHTDVDGNVFFLGVHPSNSDVIYMVSASGGYFADTGYVSLPFTSVAITDLNTIVESIYLTRPGIAISLSEDLTNYAGSATIRVDGINYPFDSIVGTSFLALDTGLHYYSVIPDDITKTIVSGSFTVGISGSDFLTIQIAEAYKVEIIAQDASGNPIEGAVVILAGDTVLTDITGDAVFLRIAKNSYSYSINKRGYDSIPATVLAVDTTNIVEIVKMSRNLFIVTFIISDASGFVANASVTLDGILIHTDASGKAIFIDKSAGDYTFKIEKTGYADSTGIVTISNEDVTLDLIILLTGLKDNFSNYIRPYPNPTSNLIYISIPTEMSHPVVSVLNSSGERLLQTGHDNSQGTIMSIDLFDFPSGIYLIEIADKDIKQTWSVLKR